MGKQLNLSARLSELEAAHKRRQDALPLAHELRRVQAWRAELERDGCLSGEAERQIFRWPSGLDPTSIGTMILIENDFLQRMASDGEAERYPKSQARLLANLGWNVRRLEFFLMRGQGEPGLGFCPSPEEEAAHEAFLEKLGVDGAQSAGGGG